MEVRRQQPSVRPGCLCPESGSCSRTSPGLNNNHTISGICLIALRTGTSCFRTPDPIHRKTLTGGQVRQRRRMRRILYSDVSGPTRVRAPNGGPIVRCIWGIFMRWAACTRIAFEHALCFLWKPVVGYRKRPSSPRFEFTAVDVCSKRTTLGYARIAISADRMDFVLPGPYIGGYRSFSSDMIRSV